MRQTLALLLLLLAGPALRAADSLTKLQQDPSAEAGAKLDKLFRKTRDGDQRFWLIRVLGYRLKEHADPGSLDTLLFAVEDEDPAVRGPALRALSAFGALPKKAVEETWIARLDAAAQRGALDPSPVVREGAADLLRAIRLWRDPASRKTPPPPADEGVARRFGLPFLVRMLRFFSILGVPALILFWLALRLPVFDPDAPGGRFSVAAWGVLKEQRLSVAIAGTAWVYLCMVLVGYGYEGWIHLLAGAGATSSGTWIAAYFTAWFCVFGPGAMLAAGLARRPEASAAASVLPVLPQVIALSVLIAAVFAPLELGYRLFFRRARSPQPRGLSSWFLETGTLRGAYLVSAVMAREEHGIVPAMERARAIASKVRLAEGARLGLSAFDLRFCLLAGAPVFALFCGLLAKTLSVRLGVSWFFVFFGCGLWSAAVMTVMLYAIVQVLEGTAAAGRYHLAAGNGLPEAFEPFREFFVAQGEDDEREDGDPN